MEKGLFSLGKVELLNQKFDDLNVLEKVLNGEIEIEDLEPDLQHRLIELCKERESEVEKKTKKIELEIAELKDRINQLF